MKKIVLLLIFPLLFVGKVFGDSPITFTIGTYNLRNANSEDSINGDGWGQRVPFIAKLVMFHGLDIFGTQEGLFHQLQDMKNLLPDYDYIGIGRDDGKQKGEYSAIFYRKDKFKLLDSGNFWLSKDQTKPNLGWDAVCIRICTWGKFQEISSGNVFVLFNLHMDHVGVVAREESSKLILRKIKEMPQRTPVILTGDFNVDQFSPSYQLLNTSGVLHDSYDKSPLKYDMAGTFNGFHPESSVSSGRIDHIFLTNQFSVLKYGILTDTYRIYQGKSGVAHCPSDHFPVMAIVKLQ